MNLRTIKTTAELPFKGIEFVKTDGNITEIIIGGKLRINRADGYSTSLRVLIEAPYEAQERYRVTAKTKGFDAKVTYFESQYDAVRAVSDYERDGAEATSEKVRALIDDAGVVRGIEDPADPQTTPAAAVLEDIPF